MTEGNEILSEILSNFVALMMIEIGKKRQVLKSTAIKGDNLDRNNIKTCGFTSKKIISKILVFGSIKKIYKLNKAI